MRRALLSMTFGVTLPSIGDSFMGGYYAGIMDTTKGNIIAADYFQTGARYALISAGVALESASLKYQTSTIAAPASSSTRWNGLDATIAMNSAAYPAAQYCYGLSSPSDGASAWYLPAMDEQSLLYRNLKPTTSNNTVGSTSPAFPGGTQNYGVNPSSSPTGAAFTSGDPTQTGVAAFKAAGGQSFGGGPYWASTEGDASGAWILTFTDGSFAGQQVSTGKTSSFYVRPVRRLIL